MKNALNNSIVGNFYEKVILNIESGGEAEVNDVLLEQVEQLINNLASPDDHLDENVKAILATPEFSREEQRICILLSAMKKGQGLTEVSSVLEACKMRALYVRNLFEFILHYCFCSNERGDKYTLRKFNALYNKCAKLLKKVSNTKRLTFETNGKDPTLRELDALVEQNVIAESDGGLMTNNLTQDVLAALEQVESLDGRADDAVIKLVESYSAAFVDECAITRYYVARYISYVVKAQIREFKDILCEFTGMTTKQVFDKYSSLAHSNFLSLRTAFSHRLYWYYEETGLSKPTDQTQLRRDILHCLVESFVLYGSNPNAKSKLMTTLAQFKDNIRIFKDDDKEVAALAEEVHNLSLEDFYDYKIDLQILYELLFERVLTLDHKEMDDLAKDFIKGVLKGTCDLSRNAFMFFLSNTSQILKNSDMYDYIDSCDSLGIRFRSKDELNQDRFESIINRCHFAPVGDYPEDSLYYTNLSLPTQYFQQWKDAIEELNAVPYEVEYISSASIRKIKDKYKGVL